MQRTCPSELPSLKADRARRRASHHTSGARICILWGQVAEYLATLACADVLTDQLRAPFCC
eukprot:15382133-Alexandrium_andersonii.AAC.1